MSNPKMPSEVTPDVGFFDTFAEKAAVLASRPPFFLFCLLLILAWVILGVVKIIVTGDPGYALSSNFQLLVNSPTTIITFLLVALLQNSAARTNLAIHHKLNAIADGLADFMEQNEDLTVDVKELRAAVGIEEKESTN